MLEKVMASKMGHVMVRSAKMGQYIKNNSYLSNSTFIVNNKNQNSVCQNTGFNHFLYSYI